MSENVLQPAPGIKAVGRQVRRVIQRPAGRPAAGQDQIPEFELLPGLSGEGFGSRRTI